MIKQGHRQAAAQQVEAASYAGLRASHLGYFGEKGRIAGSRWLGTRLYPGSFFLCGNLRRGGIVDRRRWLRVRFHLGRLHRGPGKFCQPLLCRLVVGIDP